MNREQKLLDKITAFARDAHAGQERKYTGEPYINHPIDVMLIVKRYGGSFAQQAAALLHDTVEDTDVDFVSLSSFLFDLATRYDMTPVELVDIQKMVVDLTDVYTKEDYPAWNRKKRKQAEAERLGKVSAEAQTVKYADLMSNTPSIRDLDPKFAKVYLAEKKVLMEEMKDGNPIMRNNILNDLRNI